MKVTEYAIREECITIKNNPFDDLILRESKISATKLDN